jgi:hypothetical protein
LCLDPDPAHVSILAQQIGSGALPPFCKAQCGILSDLPADATANTIVYIDVLEHIEDDAAEIRTAIAHLRPAGHLIVLAPAFNWLYSPFDQAVGHYRRYDKKDAWRLGHPSLSLRSVFFLDSIGFLASLANRLYLRAPLPSPAQIQFWDKKLVPMSIFADRLFGSLFGRTIVMIWAKH